MKSAHALIVDAVRAGVLLYHDGDCLRYKALDSMPPDLADRIKAHKTDVLAVLRAAIDIDTDTEIVPENLTRAIIPLVPQMDLRIASTHSDNTIPNAPSYTPDELRLLDAADIQPGDIPLLDSVKSVFSEAVVIDAQRRPCSQPTVRRKIAELIRHARRTGQLGEAMALRDAWRERIAICMIEGGLSEADAQQIALAELDLMIHPSREDAL